MFFCLGQIEIILVVQGGESSPLPPLLGYALVMVFIYVKLRKTRSIVIQLWYLLYIADMILVEWLPRELWQLQKQKIQVTRDSFPARRICL